MRQRLDLAGLVLLQGASPIQPCSGKEEDAFASSTASLRTGSRLCGRVDCVSDTELQDRETFI